jgi:general secretion pathway protein N
MRVRLPLGRTVFFVCALLFALIALLPMRLALGWLGVDSLGLTARQAQGSVWLGGLTEARIGDAPLGNLSAGLSPIQLLVGRARVNVSNGQDIAGGIGVSRNSMGVDDLTGAIPVAAVFAPLPVETLDLSDVSVRFDDGQCARAEGQVKASLSGDIAGIPLAQGLIGNARCEGGALLLPLTGQSGMERLALKLFADGRYTLDLSIRPGDPALGERLTATGFRPSEQGYTLGVQGRF